MHLSSYFKAISQILILAMLNLCWLTSYGYAEMVPTESSIEQPSTSNTDRQRLNELLDKQEVVEELEKYGISKVEAAARINSLTDEEIVTLNKRIEQLPAAAGAERIVDALAAAVIIAAYFVGLIIKSIECIFTDCEYKGGASYLFNPFWKDKPVSESSGEMWLATQCYSRCDDNYYSCINSDDEDSPPVSQCETEKQGCFQMCDVEYTKGNEKNPTKEDCDPIMEFCSYSSDEEERESDEPEGSTYKSDPIEHGDCEPGLESCD